MLDDSVFVTVLSKSGGVVAIKSGSNEVHRQEVPAGVTAFAVPMGVGKQVFAFEAAGRTAQNTSTVDISDQCWVSTPFPTLPSPSAYDVKELAAILAGCR